MKIALLGDLALFGFNSTENSKIYEYLLPLKKELSKYDLVVANLETPLTSNNKKIIGKSAHIKSLESNVEILKFLNVKGVNLSNNHIFDFKEKGLVDTIQLLEKNDIFYFGINEKELIYEYNGNKIVFNGYSCYTTNPPGSTKLLRKNTLNILDYNKVKSDLRKYKDKSLLPIMSFHIGEEHVKYPIAAHVKFARELSEDHDYIFWGHHPHVIQGTEHYNNSLINYSLGNFLFDDVYTKKSETPLVALSEKNKESIILSLEIENNVILNYNRETFYFSKEKIEFKINKSLEEIDNCLKESYIEIDAQRTNLRNIYINTRKNNRDFQWYIKRLNLNTFIMIIRSKYYKFCYHHKFKKFIK